MLLLLASACAWVLPSLVQPGTPTPGCAALADPVQVDRIETAVGWLATGPRATEARRAEVRSWLRSELEAAAFAVEELPFSQDASSSTSGLRSGVKGTNVVAHGPDRGRVVVGAHYDTVADSPGADDNASGVAVVLEVARALGPGVPVTWVFFDAEEPSKDHGDATAAADGRNFAFGSQAFVDRAPDAWDLAFVVESVGFACDRPKCQSVPAGVPASFPRDGTGVYWAVNTSDRDWGELLATWRAAAPDRPAHAVAIPGKGKAVAQSRFSDHAAFWDAGVDAVLLTDTALLRNPAYHREGDTADTLDPVLLAQVARGLAAAVGAATHRCPSAAAAGPAGP